MCPVQGTGGLRLISSARTCELYTLAEGSSEPSYAGSLRGTPWHPQHTQHTQHTQDTQPPLGAPVEDQLLPPLSPQPPQQDQTQRQQHDQLHSWQQQQQQQSEGPQPAAGGPLVPGGQLWQVEQQWRAGQPPHTIVLRLLSLADRDRLQLHSLQLLPSRAGALHGGASAAGTAAGEADAGEAGAAPQPAPEAAGAGSQLDEVRSMLSSMLTAEGSNGGSGGSSGGGSSAAPDPRRALMAAIAKSVLRQAPQQHRASALGQLVQQGPSGGEAETSATAEAAPASAAPADPSQHQVATALAALSQRVAGLEAVCGEMHGMLQQLLQASAGAATSSGTPAK